MTTFNLDHPVFANLPDGSYAIYDPYLLLQENTMENPIPDGGGQTTLQSVTKANDKNFEMVFQRDDQRDGDNFIEDDDEKGYVLPGILSGEEQAVWCSNTFPNFLNEEYCHLSFSTTACSRDQLDHEDMVL
eukprot:15351230-Ditylum_brightwellii.AAC.1